MTTLNELQVNSDTTVFTTPMRMNLFYQKHSMWRWATSYKEIKTWFPVRKYMFESVVKTIEQHLFFWTNVC